MNSNEFFFCYDIRLARYLKFNKGINFLTNARHKDTNNEFWMFHKSDELHENIQEWRRNMDEN